MTIAILINGFAPADLAHALPANDRGFCYGDGLFETALLQGNSIRFLDSHLDRLFAGCDRLRISAPDRPTLIAEIGNVCGNLHSGVLKIVLSRGPGARGYRPDEQAVPTRVVALYAAPADVDRRALRLRWCETRVGRNVSLAGLKHLNRLEQVLAQAEWNDSTIDEGLMLDTEGELVGGTASNLFIVRDGVLMTPDLRFCGIRGVMRAQVLRCARHLGVPTSEEPLWPADLESAHEVFITNAVRGIRSVGALESKAWHDTTLADALSKELSL